MFSPAENSTENHMVGILEPVVFEFADVDVREVILQDFSKPQGRSLTHVQHFTRSSAALSTRRALHALPIIPTTSPCTCRQPVARLMILP